MPRQCGQAWRKEADQMTDKALRYRANACPPPGEKIFTLCGSGATVVVAAASLERNGPTPHKTSLEELKPPEWYSAAIWGHTAESLCHEYMHLRTSTHPMAQGIHADHGKSRDVEVRAVAGAERGPLS